MIDVNLPYTQPTTSPRISDFTERILLQLKPLTEGDEEIQNHVIEENEVGEQDERTQAIKLLKTGGSSVCHLCSAVTVNAYCRNGVNFKLNSIFEGIETKDHFLNIKKSCLHTSAVLKWLIASAGRSFSTAVPEQLRLLPLLFKVKHSFIQSLDLLASSLPTLIFFLVMCTP